MIEPLIEATRKLMEFAGVDVTLGDTVFESLLADYHKVAIASERERCAEIAGDTALWSFAGDTIQDSASRLVERIRKS